MLICPSSSSCTFNICASVKLLSRVRLFVIPWTVAYQAPPSMEFSRQEYWHGLPFPSPGDLPNPGIEPRSPTLQADTLPSESPGKTVFKLYVKRNLFKKRYKEYLSTHFRTGTSRTVISKLNRDFIHKSNVSELQHTSSV